MVNYELVSWFQLNDNMFFLYPASVLTTNVMLVQASWRISRAVAQSIKVVINMYSMCWMFTKRFVINTRIFNTHMLKLTYTINTDRHKIAAAVWAQQKVCFLQFYFSVVNHQGQQGILCWLLTVTFYSFSPHCAASSRICTHVFYPIIFQQSCVVLLIGSSKKARPQIYQTASIATCTHKIIFFYLSSKHQPRAAAT